MHAPSPSIPPRPALRESTAARSEVENRIFAGRRSYTLSVNMPNLNAATGSWIIHFVERQPGAASPIAAPEVVNKSDPAYPGELIKDGVHGTVILTAIIRANGSVADIVVVQSLDPRLDRNACSHLHRTARSQHGVRQRKQVIAQILALVGDHRSLRPRFQQFHS